MGEKTEVLVVDDDRRMVKTIGDILKIKGYVVSEAYSGQEALEKVKDDCPDCVLMDIRMPGINGVEAMKLIKEIAPALLVVLMSAYATEELEQEARKNGAYAVLAKPLDFQIVLSFLSLIRKEESILIVDDDPNFCRTLKDILLARGCRVETEMDPDHVLGHLERNYQLVVLLDLTLGKADGIDVLKSIRARYPTKPVVLVTDHKEDMVDTVEKGLRMGAHTCFYKPLDTEALFEAIHEIKRNKLRQVLEADG